MSVIPSSSQPEVVVEQVEALRRWLLNGVSVALVADAPLPSPLSRTLVFAHSDGREAGLVGLIFARLPSVGNLIQTLTTPSSLVLRPPVQSLHQELVAIQDDGAVFIVGRDGRRSIAVTQGILPHQVSVVVGDWPLYQWVTPAISVIDPERFALRVNQYCEVLSATLRGLYFERDVK
ncbi:MAG: hypothetical protein M1296_04965, partial [Chloroflexi bacterium]|nr:hypothetical protein [Chloroflexota bacterium]